MDILFIHKVFPGQFKHLIRRFSGSQANRVVAVCQEFAPEFHAKSYPGCRVIAYRPRGVTSDRIHRYAQRIHGDVLNGEGVLGVLRGLQTQGFEPEVIIAHTGWGEALYCKDVFPRAALIGYFEFYYDGHGAEADFDPEYRLTLDERCRIRTLNAAQLLSLVDCDAGVSPMRWQRQLYPKELRSKIHVIHEGVDIGEFRPDRLASFALPNGEVLDRSMETVTYVSRNLEPYRGFPQFMRAVELLQRRRPQVRVVVAGGDDVSYSRTLRSGRSYREKLCAELDLDMERLHFLGWLPYEAHRRLLQVSSVHVYLTVPFALSWSLIEAMATGCVVAGSDTPPVREVIRQGENGLLFDFHSPEQLAQTVEDVLDHHQRMRSLGEQARRDVMKDFNMGNQVSRYAQLIQAITGGRLDAGR